MTGDLPADRQPPGDRRWLLIVGPDEIVTMAGGLRMGSAQAAPAVLRTIAAGRPDMDAAGSLAIAIHDGRIWAVGSRRDVYRRLAAAGLDLDQMERHQVAGTVTPGLIDPHTHLVFGGTREREIGLRQSGAGYLDILAGGGGILSTVAATRAADTPALQLHAQRWLREMSRHGVTTVEAKSGYGLDTATELRLLDVLGTLREGIQVVPTFLGAHAVPREFREHDGGPAAYMRAVIEEQLPAVSEQGIARFIDVFCEPGVFSVEQSREILRAGERHGLRPRIHAEQLSASGGARLAAELGAASADHLGAIDADGLDALAAAAAGGTPVVATLLPGASLFLREERHAPARALIERGVPVALGTDFNPGTSPVPNLHLVISLAVLELGMTAAEALAAVTINAAHSLGLAQTHGSIEEGKLADLAVWDVPRHELIPYWVGAATVVRLYKEGRLVRE